jgi:hypothetical protein
LADVTDADIDVFLVYGDDEVSSLPLCRTFVRSGRLWMDCAPLLHRRYAAPVPDDVLISRNEECLTTGRYGVFVPVWSRLGRLVADLVDLTERKPRTDVQSPPTT